MTKKINRKSLNINYFSLLLIMNSSSIIVNARARAIWMNVVQSSTPMSVLPSVANMISAMLTASTADLKYRYVHRITILNSNGQKKTPNTSIYPFVAKPIRLLETLL